jgi:hypothetical protein
MTEKELHAMKYSSNYTINTDMTIDVGNSGKQINDTFFDHLIVILINYVL